MKINQWFVRCSLSLFIFTTTFSLMQAAMFEEAQGEFGCGDTREMLCVPTYACESRGDSRCAYLGNKEETCVCVDRASIRFALFLARQRAGLPTGRKDW